MPLISLPPAFTSGKPHKGHVSYLVKGDALHRAKLKKGYNVPSVLGYDCHGLPIKIQVKKLLGLQTNVPEYTIARRYVVEAIKEFEKIVTALNIKIDHRWTTADLFYQITVDELTKKAVNQKLLYCKQSIQEYCAHCEQYVAASEINSVPVKKQGYLVDWFINGHKYVVMTTKPQLLKSARALVLSQKFKHRDLTTHYAQIPALDIKVPVYIAEGVDKYEDIYDGYFVAFCGSPSDYAFIKQHELDTTNYLDIVNKTFHGHPYSDLDATIQQLHNMYIKNNIIRRAETLTSSAVIHSERTSCKRAIHYVYNTQYYIDVQTIKPKLIDMLEHIQIHPDKYRVILEKWIHGAQDWCVGRTYAWGSHMPIHYANDGISLITSIDDITPLTNIHYDVWVDSSIAWLYTSKIAGALGPVELQIQGYQILRSWAYYSMIAAVILGYSVPFHNLKVTSLLLAQDRKKYSKASKNYEPPMQTIDKYSVEIVRLWAILTDSDADQVHREEDLIYAKKVLTKLYNIYKFAKLYPITEIIENKDCVYYTIYAQLCSIVAEYNQNLETYSFKLTRLIRYIFETISTKYISNNYNQRNSAEFRYYLHLICLQLDNVFEPLLGTYLYKSSVQGN